MPPVFLDANVFLYAAGRDHPLKGACAGVLRRLAAGELAATTSTEVVQELLYVLTRRGQREAALALARHVLVLVPDLLPVSRAVMEATCELLADHPNLPVRDVVHVATMREHGLDEIVSADRDFDAFEGVTRLDPGA